LKQLQLIQILSIKPPMPAIAGDPPAKVPPVNRKQRAPNAAKAASGNAETASKLENQGIWSALRFTAR